MRLSCADSTAGEDDFPSGADLAVANWLGSKVVNRTRMHLLYSGRVQGVGFRYTVKTAASGFEVTGAVRNLADGRVELLAEGQRAELEAFRLAIRESGLEHFIQKEDVAWTDAQNEFRGFEIVS